jgi:hypothetical protein
MSTEYSLSHSQNYIQYHSHIALPFAASVYSKQHLQILWNPLQRTKLIKGANLGGGGGAPPCALVAVTVEQKVLQKRFLHFWKAIDQEIISSLSTHNKITTGSAVASRKPPTFKI